MKPETPIDWVQFERANALLAKKIKQSENSFDIVLAINRGGAISGVCVAHLLGISNFMTFTVQTLVTDEANAARQEAIITGTENLHKLAGKRVLLVDDAVGSGITLVLAKKALAPIALESLTTAATIWNTEDHRVCPADHFGGTTPGWVLFPWEIAARAFIDE